MRRIITKEEADLEPEFQSSARPGKVPGSNQDNYLGRLLACMPAETVSVYVMIQKAFEQFGSSVPIGVQYCMVALVGLGNILYLRHRKVLLTQYFISTIAFFIWAYSFGEPFKHLLGSNYFPAGSTLGILIFGFLAPVIPGYTSLDKTRKK